MPTTMTPTTKYRRRLEKSKTNNINRIKGRRACRFFDYNNVMYLRASGEGSGRADRGDEDSSRELHFDIIFCFNLLSWTNCENKAMGVRRREIPWQPKNTVVIELIRTLKMAMGSKKVQRMQRLHKNPGHDKGIKVRGARLTMSFGSSMTFVLMLGQKKDRNHIFEFWLARILHILLFIGWNHGSSRNP